MDTKVVQLKKTKKLHTQLFMGPFNKNVG